MSRLKKGRDCPYETGDKVKINLEGTVFEEYSLNGEVVTVTLWDGFCYHVKNDKGEYFNLLPHEVTDV